METKLIVQKNFLEDQLVWAINLTPEFEVRKFDGEETWETELALELTSGLSYRFAPPVVRWAGDALSLRISRLAGQRSARTLCDLCRPERALWRRALVVDLDLPAPAHGPACGCGA